VASFSEERISHLAHLSVGAVRPHARIRNERLALMEAKRVLAEVFQTDDRFDQAIRRKIPPRIPPGSRQWDILYRQLMEEELRKHR
jgi:hypothetical protein